MKILHIINNLGSGGAEKLLEELIPLINESNDIRADILLLTDENNVFEDSLMKKGVKVDIIKHRNMYDPRNILEVKKHIVNGRYDIVHSHIFPTQYWVALSRLIIRNKNIKFITTEHSTHNRRRENPCFKPIDRFIYKQYDVIISITEKTKENLLNWMDPKRKNVHKHIVIKNGVNIKEIREAMPYKKNDLIEGISEDVQLVCMVGRFSEAKDQPTLIKAISKVPKDVHLVLVGEGPLIDKNKELVKKLGVSNRVHFLGFRHDVPRILKTVDVVVLSSHWEGFGLVAVEGMAAEKPTIGSDVEGLRDVIGNKDMLFPKKDAEILMKMILNLFDNKEVYNRQALYCKRRSEQYTIEKHTIKTIDIYRKLLKTGGNYEKKDKD